MQKYDVVIVGAGTAGCYNAYLLASKGFNVALVEVKDKEEIGNKVCGDAIGKHHFDNLGLSYPSGKELEGVFKGIIIYSPKEDRSILVRGEGFAINRYWFGQRLLKMALDKGVDLYDNHLALEPIIRDEYVIGVKARPKGTFSVREIHGKVIVDASGAVPALRSRLPTEWWVSERASKEDYNITYREIRKIPVDVDTRYASIYLSKKIAPGGYWWFFPKTKNKINVGLGLQWSISNVNPRQQYEKFILTREIFKNSKLIHGGGGLVPTRRFLECPVWNGFVAIGDAAYTANPIHGGGIGPSLISAKSAADAIEEALERDNPSIENLWEYPQSYINLYGTKQAKLDILRIFLQKLDDDDLQFIFDKEVITGDEISDMGFTGELKMSILNRVSIALKLVTRPSLLKKLKIVKDYIGVIGEMYARYPQTPRDYLRWRHKLGEKIKEFKLKLEI